MHLLCPRTARQSGDCLRVRVLHSCTAIFAPSALFPGISRRCTGRSVRLRLRSPRFASHPPLPQMASGKASAAACIAPLCVASQSIHICQAVCHPLSGGSVACLVCASPHFTQATAPFARSLPVSVLPFSAMPFSVCQFALHCALKSHFPCARQGLKAKHCSQSVQAIRLAPILAKVRIDN